MSSKKKACKTPPAPSEYITIPLAEYDRLQRLAALLDIIMHDHTSYRESVGIVKNVLIDNGMRAEAGVEE